MYYIFLPTFLISLLGLFAFFHHGSLMKLQEEQFKKSLHFLQGFLGKPDEGTKRGYVIGGGLVGFIAVWLAVVTFISSQKQELPPVFVLFCIVLSFFMGFRELANYKSEAQKAVGLNYRFLRLNQSIYRAIFILLGISFLFVAIVLTSQFMRIYLHF